MPYSNSYSKHHISYNSTSSVSSYPRVSKDRSTAQDDNIDNSIHSIGSLLESNLSSWQESNNENEKNNPYLSRSKIEERRETQRQHLSSAIGKSLQLERCPKKFVENIIKDFNTLQYNHYIAVLNCAVKLKKVLLKLTTQSNSMNNHCINNFSENASVFNSLLERYGKEIKPIENKIAIVRNVLEESVESKNSIFLEKLKRAMIPNSNIDITVFLSRYADNIQRILPYYTSSSQEDDSSYQEQKNVKQDLYTVLCNIESLLKKSKALHQIPEDQLKRFMELELELKKEKSRLKVYEWLQKVGSEPESEQASLQLIDNLPQGKKRYKRHISRRDGGTHRGHAMQKHLSAVQSYQFRRTDTVREISINNGLTQFCQFFALTELIKIIMKQEPKVLKECYEAIVNLLGDASIDYANAIKKNEKSIKWTKWIERMVLKAPKNLIDNSLKDLKDMGVQLYEDRRIERSSVKSDRGLLDPEDEGDRDYSHSSRIPRYQGS